MWRPRYRHARLSYTFSLRFGLFSLLIQHHRYYPLQGRSGRLLSSLPPLLKQPPPCRTLSCRAGAAAPFRRVPERGFRAAGGAGLGRALAQHSACQPADSGEHPERTLEHPAAAAGTGAGSLGLARRAGRGGVQVSPPAGTSTPPPGICCPTATTKPAERICSTRSQLPQRPTKNRIF